MHPRPQKFEEKINEKKIQEYSVRNTNRQTLCSDTHSPQNTINKQRGIRQTDK